VAHFSHSRPSRDRTHRRRAAVLAGPVLAIAGLLAGCGSSAPSAPAAAAPSAASSPSASPTASTSYPVTVTNCGVPVTYTKAPSRAVSNDINTTEDMLALGLEKLVGLHPDFLFAGWNYGLETGTNLTPDGLAKYGIKVLAPTESCAHVQPGKTSVSIGNTYQDLRNLGAIFGVRQRAQQVIAGMQAQVAAVRAKVAKLKPVTVFDYDSGDSAPFTAGGLAPPRPSRRNGSWRPARSPRTSPRSRASASCRWPTTRSPLAPATATPSPRWPACCAQRRSASQPTVPELASRQP
jgi:ABC-type Fe3+-hydroxamate transport system substrate-binding protein